jgi:hypothetical protein
MGRFKITAAVVCVVISLLGVGTLVATQGGRDSNHAVPVDNGTAPANAAPASAVPQPSVQDIQQLIAGITAQVTAPSGTPGATPLTAAEIESRVREELKKLGITL